MKHDTWIDLESSDFKTNLSLRAQLANALFQIEGYHELLKYVNSSTAAIYYLTQNVSKKCARRGVPVLILKISSTEIFTGKFIIL
jgi:hypothetical protein